MPWSSRWRSLPRLPDARGESSFAPSLVAALQPGGHLPTRDGFISVLSLGRPDKGMPSAGTLGLDAAYFAGLYSYLKGRSEGAFTAAGRRGGTLTPMAG